MLGFTSLDALEHEYRVILIEDACRGVNVPDIDLMKKRICDNHGIIVASNKVIQIRKNFPSQSLLDMLAPANRNLLLIVHETLFTINKKSSLRVPSKRESIANTYIFN